jgi:predicted dehydrogenase
VRALAEGRHDDELPPVERRIEAYPGGRHALASREALAAWLDALDVLFVAAPTSEHFRVARIALRKGIHLFLEWPPATSLRECRAIGDLAEEAGVEVGVSRPLRFHPLFRVLPDEWRARLVVIRQEVAVEAPASWSSRLADALDLCFALVRSTAVQRIHAEAVRNSAAWPDAVAIGLRFSNGSYGQLSLRQGDMAPFSGVYAAGPRLQLDADLGEQAVRLRRTGTRPEALAPAPARDVAPLIAETHAFLQAVAGGRPVPYSVLDGVDAMRLYERVLARLR